KVDNKREPNDFESFHLCYKTKDSTYLQEATRDMMVIANREISSKQVETQGLQMKNMDQKLNEVYGMLKLLPAFPDLDNVAFTFAAGTCDKEV
nr:ribose 5-phosphate isomerase, type A [Tanacetum cinerariifolium]